MKKFNAIEGLRGYLAWTVVFSHLALTSNIYAKGLGPAAVEAGHYAVLVFIIISGFVITQLTTEKPEPYGTYILRRFMRIFPLFAVTCVIGYFTTDIYAHTMSQVRWTIDPLFATRIQEYADIARSDHEFFAANVLAHVLMLHGAISNNLVPFSQYAFNAPSWSLSLEWQFYLVAPFVIVLARRPGARVWAALGIAALEIAYNMGLFGSFYLPSFLPGAAGYFCVGIASRLAYSVITGAVRNPNVILALVIVLIPLGWDALPLLVWVIVLMGLSLHGSVDTQSFVRLYRRALESRGAIYFGSRSYSVYLCHAPIIAIYSALWFRRFPESSNYPYFFGVSAMALPLTLIVSELLYRGIERPGIALGSRLARWGSVTTIRGFPGDTTPLAQENALSAARDVPGSA